MGTASLLLRTASGCGGRGRAAAAAAAAGVDGYRSPLPLAREAEAGSAEARCTVSRREETADTLQEERKYVLRLSQALICQHVCHQPFESGLVQDDGEAMDAFIRTAGCRRKVMSEYMDGKQLSCAELQAREPAVEVAACDNCEEQQSSGHRAWQNEQAVQAVQEQVVRAKLEELANSICPYCWAIVHEVFDGKAGEAGEAGRQEQEAMRHSFWQCPRVRQGTAEMKEMEEIRRGVRYSRDVRTCRKCGMMDYLCERGSSSSSSSSGSQQNCAWPNVVIPLLCGLRAAAEAKATLDSSNASARTYTTLGRVGYREKNSNSAEFSKWISRQHGSRRLFNRVVGNGVAAVVVAILEEKS